MPTQFCQTSGSGYSITQSFNQSHQICLTLHNLMITQLGRFENPNSSYRMQFFKWNQVELFLFTNRQKSWHP